MVGKCPRKRDYSRGTINMDSPEDIDCGVVSNEGGKRLRLTVESGGESSSMSPGSDKSSPGEVELMLDSGCDTLPMEPMESSIHMEEEDEDEPYIDVVSEDSAVHDDELLEDEYSVDDPSAYHHIASHMDNLISSHDDSAIIKSEIFDPAYDEMHQMLVESSGADYEHTFLNGVDTSSVSSLLDKSDTDLIFTTTSCDSVKDTIGGVNNNCLSTTSVLSALSVLSPGSSALLKEHSINVLDEKANNHINTSYEDLSSSSDSVTSNNCLLPPPPLLNSSNSGQHPGTGVSIQATLVSAPGLLPTVPNPVVNINNLNAASMLGGNAPVLTTPVFLAQGTPGPAGQTNSIITTHLARLVPSPDGKGYILHLGLTPTSMAGTTLPSSLASVTGVGGLQAVSGSINVPFSAIACQGGNNNTAIVPSSTKSATMSISESSPPLISSSQHQASNLNITIATPGGVSTNGKEGGEQVHSPVILTGVSPIQTGSSTVCNMVTSSQLSPSRTLIKEGSLAVSQKSPPANHCHAGQISVNSSGGTTTNIITGGKQVGGVNVLEENTGLSFITTINATASDTINGLIEAGGMSLVNRHPGGIEVNENGTVTTSGAQLSLLDGTQKLMEQTQHIQLIHTQQQQQQHTQQQSRSKSKRRNSKELRELMELEQIVNKPGGDTDRFVICSDGPMNCALCGYNTGSYSSFKSHIICSHPCWRITKKLSRNRLLVEKSVKVSVPVANFSVPNPIPAVPIQQRVQSKKSKKEQSGNGSNSNSSGGKDNNKDSSDNSKKDNNKISKDNTTTKDNISESKSLIKKENHSPSSLPLSASVIEKTASNRDIDLMTKEIVNNISRDIPALVVETTTTTPGNNTDSSKLNSFEGKRCIYKCTRCLRLFVSEDTTLNHILYTHFIKKPYNCIEISNDYGKTFAAMHGCPVKGCGFSCESLGELERHKAEAHAQQVVYRCQICGYSAESTKAVKEHAVKIHRQQVMMYGLAD